MPRSLRIDYPGAWHWVNNTTSPEHMLFASPSEAAHFLTLVKASFEVYQLDCFGYCLLPREYHILIRSNNGHLSRGIQLLNSKYTQWLNEARNRTGKIFLGRFKSKMVEPSLVESVLETMHRIPVQQNLSDLPEVYRWSSAAYLSRNKPIPGSLNLHRWEPEMAQLTAPNGNGRANGLGIQAIIDQVAAAFNVNPKEILASKRGRGHRQIPRSVALYACRQKGAFPIATLAKEFGMGHESAVSINISRLQKEMKTKPELNEKVLTVISTLQ